MKENRQDGPVCVVLDTSVFSNPDTGRQWGENATEALQTFVALGRKTTGRVGFYMPPSILEEIKTFVDELPPDLELVVNLKAPNRYGVEVPGFLLYEIIDELRGRIDRGLRVAERAVRETEPENVDRSITRLREKYRAALRSGLLDSREDVDVILLANELGAALVSSDQAVVTWAEKLGIRLIHPQNLRRLLEAVASEEEAAEAGLGAATGAGTGADAG